MTGRKALRILRKRADRAYSEWAHDLSIGCTALGRVQWEAYRDLQREIDRIEGEHPNPKPSMLRTTVTIPLIMYGIAVATGFLVGLAVWGAR